MLHTPRSVASLENVNVGFSNGFFKIQSNFARWFPVDASVGQRYAQSLTDEIGELRMGRAAMSTRRVSECPAEGHVCIQRTP